jgi:stage V sporulation protein SpoVS
MLALAWGVAGAGAPMAVAAGAVAFAVSDLAVARERFVAPGGGSWRWGLPLYYGAQIAIAASAAAPG